jgi:hypothetical protein
MDTYLVINELGYVIERFTCATAAEDRVNDLLERGFDGTFLIAQVLRTNRAIRVWNTP